MSIVVTGASGKLGRLVVDALLERGVEPSQIVATGRDPERLADYARRGVQSALVDFDDQMALLGAFEGAERVLFVSARGNPDRVAQHRRVIDSAKDAGVGLLVYTSYSHADISRTHSEHHTTELDLQLSGVPFVVLRNPPYLEFRTREIPVWRQGGAIVGAARDGRLSAVTRADLADAAAAVLTGEGHEGSTYELGSDDPFTMTEFAAELSAQSGEEIPYVDLPAGEFRARLVKAGVKEAVAAMFAEVELAMAGGELVNGSGALRRLRGRPATTLPEAIAAALSSPVDAPSLPVMRA
jgi:NAD(P)H dehydrogenase (quinone)